MRRRSRASSKLAKAQSRKVKTLKRTTLAVRHSGSSDYGQETNGWLRRELDDAREQQAATADLLKVISRSTFDLQTVLDTLLKSAARLCQADHSFIFLRQGDGYRCASGSGDIPEWIEYLKQQTIRPGRGTIAARAVLERRTVHIPDVLADLEYTFLEAQRRGGYRTALGVPLLREGDPVGVIVLTRPTVRPFDANQIELVTTFAAQAVIAIENTRLLNELRESLDRQTATADILRVIASTPEDSTRALDTIAETAVRMFNAASVSLRRVEGNVLRVIGAAGPSAAKVREILPDFPLESPDPAARSVFDNRQIHIEGRRAVLPNEGGEIARVLPALPLGSQAFTPLSRQGEAIGVMVVTRSEVRPFQQIELDLMRGFADQAVIAIENARLLSELRQSLEQQTATSEVLTIISRSPAGLEPVFQAILANATRLCGAKFGTLNLYDGEVVHRSASYNVPPEYAEMRLRMGRWRPHPGSATAQVVRTKELIHFDDLRTSPAYLEGDSSTRAIVDTGGARTLLMVPMLKDDQLIGTIAIYRQEVRSFTDKQTELVENFAAQAVIAIENARLLNELRESLEQKTATSEVLSVISSSPDNIQPVLEIIGERAEKLCDADVSVTSIVDGDLIRLSSVHGVTEAGVKAVRHAFPMRLTDETVTARAIRTRSVCHVADVLSDLKYPPKDAVHAAQVGGYHGCLGVPMVRDEQVVGAIFVAKKQPGLFSDAQVQLLKTFADQAVIAIENVRLFNETKNSLEQQTATADVLKIISRSTFDLQTVLQTLVESAARFCAADNATVVREKDGLFYTAEAYGYSREFLNYLRNIPIKAERGSASGRALVEGRVVHIPDVKADPEYTFVEAPRLGDFRTALCVPMLREGIPIGVLTLTRSEVQPFTDKQIELVTTFSDQAAIAIGNVRLFDEIQDKSRQLEVASQHKSQFLANMSHELRTPLNAILGYTELMADGAYGEPSEKMLGILKRLEANGRHLLGLINDVLDLSKIETGQLVLELSDYSVQDIAQTVRSTLEPLAADKKLAFRVEMAPELPPGRGDGRRLTQVLINLVGNAIKFTDAGEVAIKAEANNGSFHVSVRDTGPGISAADQTRLFQEFQQADNAITKKKGGTGLGLAISKRIIEMHGGRIWVESQPGQGSTFAFTLPVIVERQVEPA